MGEKQKVIVPETMLDSPTLNQLAERLGVQLATKQDPKPRSRKMAKAKMETGFSCKEMWYTGAGSIFSTLQEVLADGCRICGIVMVEREPGGEWKFKERVL